MANIARPSRQGPHSVLAAILLGLFVAQPAHADITIGVILSLTGPAASLGIPAENTVKLWPSKLAGQNVHIILVNDKSDTTETAKLTSKLIDEDKVDVIVGPSLTPNSVAAVEIAGRSLVPIIALGGGNVIVDPVEGPKVWAFKMSAPEGLGVGRTVEHMKATGIKKVAVMAVSTSYGDGFLKAFQAAAAQNGIQITDVEHYAAQDLSVTPQTLKLMAASPDAVYIMSFGTPGVLPELELRNRGYAGVIYQTHGVANLDFLKLGGKGVDGTFMSVAPMIVAEQLPDSSPMKKVSIQYVTAYESKNGPNSRSLFGATAWDAWTWLEAATPVALSHATPGTPEFHQALRDALEAMHEVATPEGIFNMTPTNHNGLDQRAQVMVEVKNGAWTLVP
jgi:branched-chain amino acid transport system substrate-binding protein